MYLDNVTIFSRSAAVHFTHIRQALAIPWMQQSYVRLHKCHFNQNAIKYLGHIILSKSVWVNSQKDLDSQVLRRLRDVH